MKDNDEQSNPSTGSVGVPDWDANGDPLPAGAASLLRIAELEAEVKRLRLTDAERNAVARSAATARSNAGACAMSTMNELANTYISDAETLLALLERTK
jgi:hypothetical protein